MVGCTRQGEAPLHLARMPTPRAPVPRVFPTRSPPVLKPTETGVTTHRGCQDSFEALRQERAPYYRVVVMDSRTKRDGRAIEEIGQYHPTEEPSVIEIDPTARSTGSPWRSALRAGRGAPEAHGRLGQVQGPARRRGHPAGRPSRRQSKKELYESAVAAAGGSSLDVKDTPARKKAAPAKAAAPSQGCRGSRC